MHVLDRQVAAQNCVSSDRELDDRCIIARAQEYAVVQPGIRRTNHRANPVELRAAAESRSPRHPLVGQNGESILSAPAGVATHTRV